MRGYISAKFLLAPKLDKHDAVVLPAHIVIQKCPVKVARGSRKLRHSTVAGAKTTSTIVAGANRSIIKGLASRGW